MINDKRSIHPQYDYFKKSPWIRWYRPFIHFWTYFQFLYGGRCKLLDIGCGIGESVRQGRLIGINAFGIDISIPTLKKADKSVKSFCVIADAQRLPFRNEVFDVISAFDLLEHLPNPEFCINDVYRILKKSGCLIFTTPSKVGLSLDPTHVNEKDPYEWQRIFRFYGFKDKIFYVPAFILLFWGLRFKFLYKVLKYIIKFEALTKILFFIEEPLRYMAGIYYGKINTRLYGLAIKR